jgi:hypothetical protein
VIDISDPTSPTILDSFDAPYNERSVDISGNRAFLTNHPGGLQVIDISDPASPTLVGSYETPGVASGVAVSGAHAFVTDGYSGLQVIQVFQSEFDEDNNIGQSLPVNALPDTVFAARLTTVQSNAVTWELSADNGVNWQGIVPDGTWNQMPAAGTELVWRSTHAWAAPGVNPAATWVEIEWLGAAACMDSIVDVPNDQGGWIQVHFTRSGRDSPSEAALPIANYGIWRRVESAALIADIATQGMPTREESATGDRPVPSGMPLNSYRGNTYLQSRPDLAPGTFPPGTWVWLTGVSAVQQDTYIAAVPTLADSSASGASHTVFLLTAHTTTPSIWYVSELDSGYSVDNIAPAVPAGLAVAYNTGSGNQLSWDPCPDADFQYFKVYRSNDPGFVPAPADLVHTTTAESWSDPDYDGWGVYYKVAALDFVGNESDPASAGTTTAIDRPAIPQTFGLYPNVPNPFNPTTSIRYDVAPGGGVVTLRIYDVTGRLVRTLVDGPQPAGQKSVTWNGRDNQGRGVASGIYFYRLQASGYEKTLKMVLVQ